MTCLFCQIANKEIPANICYEDDDVIVFDDIDPKAPCHKLIIPRKHIANLNALSEADYSLMGKILHVAQKIAQQVGHDQTGYRVVTNCNDEGGQTVFHLHFHLLSGRQLHWPPG